MPELLPAQASDQSDTWGLQLGAGTDTLPDWTGAVASPTAWAADTGGYFGITVLAATGGKDTARWGTGTTATDFVNNRYAGLTTTAATIHSRSTYSAAADTIDVAYRANFSAAELLGSYTGTVTYTGVAIP